MRITALLGTAALIAAAPAFAGNHGDHDMMKSKTEMMDTQGVTSDFAAFDTDNDGGISYDEFSTYLMTNYGYTQDQVDREFTLLSDGSGIITDTNFAGMNVENLQHTKLGDQWHAGHTMSDTSMEASAPMIMQFSDYDRDDDGRVDFDEYYAWAKKDGVSSTLAAQRFNKITSGTFYLDAPTFQTAMGYGADYYDTLPYQSTTTVTTNTMVLDTSEMAPADPLNPANPVDVYDDFEPTGEYMDGMPAATVDPGYRPADRVGGDLTQTDNPLMQVRPKTIGMEDDYEVDIDID